MADSTAIEWADSTFNPWIGCTKVSPACDNCYAAVSTPARTRGIEWGAGKPRQRTSEDNWKLPLRWNRKPFVLCPQCGWRGEWSVADVNGGCCPTCSHLPERFIHARRRVFCASLSDWLDNEVPIEWLVGLLDLIRLTPNLDWLLLTKRIGNFTARLTAAMRAAVDQNRSDLINWIAAWINGAAPAHVWLGGTVVNQAEADRDIPKLLQVPARIRFLSVEPMLGPIQLPQVNFHCDLCGGTGVLARWPKGRCHHCNGRGHIPAISTDPRFGKPTTPMRFIDWIICGGESGRNARPIHPDWVRSLRDQCEKASVPFLFKQWGEWSPRNGSDLSSSGDNHVWMQRAGKKRSGNHLDGRQHLEWPC